MKEVWVAEYFDCNDPEMNGTLNISYSLDGAFNAILNFMNQPFINDAIETIHFCENEKRIIINQDCLCWYEISKMPITK